MATSSVAISQILLLDSVQTTRSVYSPVSDPFEIEANFDTITYDKAAALCRMMYTIVGEDTFRKGIQASSLLIRTGIETLTIGVDILIV